MLYEQEINKILLYLPYEKDYFKKIQELDALRYFYKENEDERERVKYDKENNRLILSDSLKIGQRIIEYIGKNIDKFKDTERAEAIKILQNNYYYLGRYLFSYYLVAIEFGIMPEKQFLAPRTSVLMPIAKKLEKFYYKAKAIEVIAMPQGTGKEQPLSSNILTPNGWAKMGNIKVGSEVIAADGSIAKVTGVFPKGIKDVYRVSFKDGTYVDCGLEHLWEVKTCEDRRNKKNARIVTTEQMLNNYILGKNSKTPYHNYSIRLVKPIQFKSKLNEDDIKPYILGALIGDGGLSRNTIKFTTSDNEILQRIEKELDKEDKISKFSGNNYDYGIASKITKRDKLGHLLKCNTLLKLEEYGLMGKRSEDKFIPKKYLYANIQERIQLLQGIMDTDGWTDKRDALCEFDTTSEQLCKDVLELIRGLGGKASYSTKQGKYKNKEKVIECQKVYRIYFTIRGINPFYLKRKAEKFSEPKFNYQKIITNIEKVRQEECQCIMIDHPEHLYVTDGYTLTHNTEIGKRFMSFCIGNAPNLPNMMVSYSASLAKDKFYNGELTLIEDENGNYQKIFPELYNVLKSAENMTLDYRNDGKHKPQSEYTLYCCGFDGGITGRTRAHNVLYIDDLIKNIEEARNKEVLDKKWEDFTGTLRKRMQGNCKMLLIGTIFSINDPTSRIIKYYKEKDPERLEVIKVPGLNENGETNFNYKYGYALTTEALLEDKDLMDTVSFECLIQQNPIERLGIVFSEEELRKFITEPEYGLERRIAAVDVAWGGGDSLSMPICSEYDNHDVYLTDVIFSQGKKEETIPLVVNAIINYKITACHFEANNGGDMYAEKVQEELKKRNYRCNITYSKVPTTKSKLDRILSVQGAIKGVAESEYRLLVKERKIIRGNKMYNDFLDELTKFNQSANMQGKQHDDAPDSLASLFANVLGTTRTGKARSRISRSDLGI